jgi:prepilin-type N-terminal cleavage/methylation domain-containing protein/prepilin-type processing-associated H-X9-DG protein
MARNVSSHSRSSKARGFTLIELLVVVAIIALLIAILIPSLGKSRDLAKMTTCRTNLRSIGQLLQMYTNMFDSYPYGDDNRGTIAGIANSGSVNTRWYLLLQNVANSSSGTTYNDAFNTNAGASKLRTMFVCPAVGDSGLIRANIQSQIVQYASHPVLLGDTNIYNIAGILPIPGPMKPTQIPKTDLAMVFDTTLVQKTVADNQGNTVGTAQAVVFDDAVASRLDNGAFFAGGTKTPFTLTTTPNSSVDMTPAFSGPANRANTDNLGSDQTNIQNIRFRHMSDTKTNVLMVDGHVDGFTLSPGAAANAANKTDLLRHYVYLGS